MTLTKMLAALKTEGFTEITYPEWLGTWRTVAECERLATLDSFSRYESDSYEFETLPGGMEAQLFLSGKEFGTARGRRPDVGE